MQKYQMYIGGEWVAPSSGEWAADSAGSKLGVSSFIASDSIPVTVVWVGVWVGV